MTVFLLGSTAEDRTSSLGTVTSSELLLLVVGSLLTLAVAVFLIVMIARKQYHDK